MKLFFISLLISSSLFSQVGEVCVLKDEKINDSTIRQTVRLVIYNVMGNPICLRVSMSYRTHILNEDSIELAPMSGSKQYSYSLSVSKADTEDGFNDSPKYPLILFPRSAFVAKLIVYRKISEEKLTLEYKYIGQPDIDYPSLLETEGKTVSWDADPKLKFRTRKILW
jgi:hypothetical protein